LPLGIALVIDLLALDLGFEISTGLLRELRDQRGAHPQRTGHFDSLTWRQRRQRAGTADLNRCHDAELAGDPRAPPKENQPDDGRDASEDREQDIHELSRIAPWGA